VSVDYGTGTPATATVALGAANQLVSKTLSITLVATSNVVVTVTSGSGGSLTAASLLQADVFATMELLALENCATSLSSKDLATSYATAGLSTLKTSDLAGLSTLTTSDLATSYTTAGLSTLKTSDLAGLSTLKTSDLAGLSTLKTSDLAGLSTLTTSDLATSYITAGLSTLKTSDLAALATTTAVAGLAAQITSVQKALGSPSARIGINDASLSDHNLLVAVAVSSICGVVVGAIFGISMFVLLKRKLEPESRPLISRY
jgi:hypothetical protein